ncbi:histidine biosynthesis bifunctional protein HisB [Bacteroidia bacterium]|nr:histidine biosynthesis bifunctional protein HisB [Bacteroidia bacterium]
MKKRALFIDRDGTLIAEPADEQIDSLAKLEFMPNVFRALYHIAHELDFELVIVTNQDGLGTASFPEDTFLPAHTKMLRAFANENIVFGDVLIDKSFPQENLPTRKPNTGLLSKYMKGDYDLQNSYVIGDRITDMLLAKNLGCKGILLADESKRDLLMGNELEAFCCLADDWIKVYELLKCEARTAKIVRHTAETQIEIALELDGSGQSQISTGIGFFDHLLDQIARHSGVNLSIAVKGDLHVDEHHTIEDTAIALGEAIYKALGSKRGIERYGFVLPMDDVQATVALDFGGRSWLVFDATFAREKVGDFPTEMASHFFKSLSDAAKMNLHIAARGDNEHHKLEGIFKSLAKALKMAIARNPFAYQLPSTKGVL